MNPRLIEEMGWRMGEVYAAVTDQILINLARHFKFFKENEKLPSSIDYQIKRLAEMGQVNRETEQIIINMLSGADKALREVIEKSIEDGIKDVEKPLKQAAQKGMLNGPGFLPPELGAEQYQAFTAYYRQSADKLNLVNTVMLESTQQAYRATVADIATRISAIQDILNVATGEVVTGVSTLNQAIKQAVQKMVENGITGFIDRGGHHWSPEAYVEMDIRTTSANTARAAVTEEMERYGCDLFSVSYHDGARPLCYPWQGKVISQSNWSGEVEDLDGEKVHVYALSETSYGEPAGLFGINCGHYKIPFVPGYNKARPPEQNEEENAKQYENTQKQRALERKVRYEKRDLEVLKAQGAGDEEIKAQRQKVKNSRENLKQFCKDNDLPYYPENIRTPIKASFPDDQKPAETESFIARKVSSTVQTPVIEQTPYSTTIDVLQEYQNGVTPGSGTITRENGTRQHVKQHEIDVANEIVSKVGGNVIMIDNSGRESKRDLQWQGKVWEVKRASTVNAAADRAKDGMKQIRKTGGNLMIDMWDDDFEASKKAAMRSIERYSESGQSLDVVMLKKGELQSISRYKNSGDDSTATQ